MREMRDPTLEPTLDPEDLPEPEGYDNKYPSRHEMLRWGGLPGVEYVLIPGAKQSFYQKLGWEPVRDMPVIPYIAGPNGRVDSVNLYCRGVPISGASPHNGIRQFYVDNTIIETTGLDPDPTAHLEGQLSPQSVEAARNEKHVKHNTVKPGPKPKEAAVA